MKLPSNINDQEILKDHKPAEKNRLKSIIKGIGLLIGLLLIGLFVKESDPAMIWIQLQKINFNFIFLMGVSFIAYLLVSIAWKQCFLKEPEKLSVVNFFIYRLIGESLAQINPTNVIAGETLKAVILKKKGIPYKDSIVSLTISRFLIIFSSIFMILLGVVIFFDTLDLFGSKVIIAAAMTLLFTSLFIIIYLLHSGLGMFKFPIYFIHKFLNKYEGARNAADKLEEIDNELIEFYKTKKLHFLSAFTLSFLHRVVGAMEFYVILYFLGIDITILSCIAVEMGVAVFKTFGAFVPGQIGFEEYGNKMMLSFINITGADIWVTVSILRRARQLVWIALGVIAFYFVMKKPNENLLTKTEELNNGSFIYHS